METANRAIEQSKKSPAERDYTATIGRGLKVLPGIVEMAVKDAKPLGFVKAVGDITTMFGEVREAIKEFNESSELTASPQDVIARTQKAIAVLKSTQRLLVTEQQQITAQVASNGGPALVMSGAQYDPSKLSPRGRANRQTTEQQIANETLNRPPLVNNGADYDPSLLSPQAKANRQATEQQIANETMNRSTQGRATAGSEPEIIDVLSCNEPGTRDYYTTTTGLSCGAFSKSQSKISDGRTPSNTSSDQGMPRQGGACDPVSTT